jgi:hypothetical protein
MGRFYQNLDFPHFDYRLQGVDQLGRREFRGPIPDLGKPYFTCIGAAQTFGRFCERPYSMMLSEALALPVLNLGMGGAGPTAFLDNNIIALINSSEFVIVQVLSGRSESNSAFSNSATHGQIGVRLRDSKRMRYEAFIKEEFEAFSRGHVSSLVEETRRNWIEHNKQLIEKISVPKILHWFSTVSPERIDNYSNWWSVLGRFPQLVNRKMLAEIQEGYDGYVETISSRGSPQKLWPSPVQINGTKLIDGWLFNNYYPSPEMHEDAAELLLPVCRKQLTKVDIPATD